MTDPISATTATPAPDYPVSFHFTDNAFRRSGNMSVTAKLPDAYVAHLARNEARKRVDAGLVDVNHPDLNLGAADVVARGVIDRLIQDYDLKAATTVTITKVIGNPVRSEWHSYVSLVGTATTSFTDDDDQTHTVNTVCEIMLDHTMFADTAHRRGHGQSLGLSPEQIQEMEGLTNPLSVVDYLNDQCAQAPLVTAELEWKVAKVIGLGSRP